MLGDLFDLKAKCYSSLKTGWINDISFWTKIQTAIKIIWQVNYGTLFPKTEYA